MKILAGIITVISLFAPNLLLAILAANCFRPYPQPWPLVAGLVMLVLSFVPVVRTLALFAAGWLAAKVIWWKAALMTAAIMIIFNLWNNLILGRWKVRGGAEGSK